MNLIPENSRVLDLGCGSGLPFIGKKVKSLVGVDLFLKNFYMPEYDKVIKYDIKKIDEIVKEGEFDIITMIDVIEHLEKQEGLNLIKKIEKIANKIIIFTPNFWRDNKSSIKDPKLWSYKNKYNIHKSLWNGKDFENLGFKIRPCRVDYSIAEKKIKKNREILLPNWTHRSDRAGGSESVYEYIKKVFPESESVSIECLFNGITCKDLIKKTDDYLIERYKENKDLIIIRDAECGGESDISFIPQIILFGNPYIAINKFLKEKIGVSSEMYDREILNYINKIKARKKVAVSNYMASEMLKLGIKPDVVLPNCVDTNIFKPLNNKENLRDKHKIPKNKKVGIWVGTDSEVKNYDMLYNLISCFQDIFWILVAKDDFGNKLENTKIFYNINYKTLNELHNCSDFFILTSPIEGCGIAMIEAMSSGIPCILSKSGYFWDYWDKRIGIQVDSENFEEHANAIIKINTIKTDPRPIVFERGLDFKTWEKKWKEIVKSI